MNPLVDLQEGIVQPLLREIKVVHEPGGSSHRDDERQGTREDGAPIQQEAKDSPVVEELDDAPYRLVNADPPCVRGG